MCFTTRSVPSAARRLVSCARQGLEGAAVPVTLRLVSLATLLGSGLARAEPPAPAPTVPGAATSAPQPEAPSEQAPSEPLPPLDQGPDTLPSLDEEQPALAEPSPAQPVRPARRRPPNRPRSSVRAERRIALSGELGWNGLAGFGVIVSYHADPHLTFDLGAGLAIVGGKLGLRARYNVTTAPITPFFGAGLIGATGWDAPTRDIAAEDSNTELNIELEPSAFLQAVTGLDWTSRNGFTMVGTLGYAWMLTDDNVVIVTGVPTEEERKAFGIAFRSGIVISLAIGYSFR